MEGKNMPNEGIKRNDVENAIQVWDFEAAVAKEIDDQGRISGFKKYSGRKCLVIVGKNEHKT